MECSVDPLTLSSTSEHRPSYTTINEHHAGAVRAITDIILTKDELPSCQVNKVIGVFADVENCVKSSFISHYAVPYHVKPSQLVPSMVSHVISNPNMFFKADPSVPDLWSRIVEIHRSRVSTGRKRVREEDEVLCAGMQSLTLDRSVMDPLEVSFKKLCLQEVDGQDRCVVVRMRKTTSKGDLSCGGHEALEDSGDSDGSETCVDGSCVEDCCCLNGKVDGAHVLSLSSIGDAE